MDSAAIFRRKMEDDVNRDGSRIMTNPFWAVDPHEMVERELEAMERRIGVMEEVVLDEENNYRRTHPIQRNTSSDSVNR